VEDFMLNRRFWFRIVVFIPFLFAGFQSVAWLIGQATLGEVLLSTQIGILTLELRRYLWTERDAHDAEIVLFRGK